MSRICLAQLTVLLGSLVSCGGDSDISGPPDTGDAPPIVAAIFVEGPVTMLWDAGARTRLTARAVDSGGGEIPQVSLHWSSRDPEVATVVDGTVTAVEDGWTVIRAEAQERSAGASIVVVTPDGPKDRLDCVACHADAYVGQHGDSGTPETCLQCHGGPTWSGGDFDHPAVANGFALLGAHATLSCAACHEADGTPLYPGVADDECIACHRADYDGQHADSGYPTTCLTCHTRDAWTGATFDHDAQYFPILVGKHQGGVGGCPTCHTNESDYSEFTCFACHPHDQNRMDAAHTGVPGYGYESRLCYACHPNGEVN